MSYLPSSNQKCILGYRLHYKPFSLFMHFSSMQVVCHFYLAQSLFTLLWVIHACTHCQLLRTQQ